MKRYELINEKIFDTVDHKELSQEEVVKSLQELYQSNEDLKRENDMLLDHVIISRAIK